MSKKSIIYVSPLPPSKSGIADYSKRLIEVLSQRFDITLYTDNNDVDKELENKYKVLKKDVNLVNFNSYDYIIYNIGNNGQYHEYIYKLCLKHPGFVILHDMVIYDLMSYMYGKKNLFFQKLYNLCGINDFYQIKLMNKEGKYDFNRTTKVPFNNELLLSGNKIIVHSWYSHDNILKTGLIDKKNLFKVNHLKVGEKLENKNISRDSLFEKFNIPKDSIIISSFGNIITTKLNEYTCKAVKNISNKTNKKICYVMVGEGDVVDSYIDGKLIIKTGYVTLDDFEAFIEYSDVIVNLRYPTLGETSGAMIRILERGKSCIINADGWFAELPSDSVYQVKRDNLEKDLEEAILKLINDDVLRKNIEKNARAYIEKEYNDGKILSDFCKILGN